MASAVKEPLADFRRLHPLTPLLRGWKWLIAAVIFAGRDSWTDFDAQRLAVVGAVVAALGLVAGALSWWFTRYGIDGEDLRIDSGVFVRRSRRVHLDRLQAVDVVRPLAARILGVSELRLEVAGGANAEAPLAYLSETDAQVLRAELLARAAGLDSQTPEAPERHLYTVPPRDLVLTTLLSPGLIISSFVALAAVVFSVVADTWFLLGILIPTVFGIGGEIYRLFVRNYNFSLAESPDGLRLRSGLLDVRAQTVPPGRVQGVSIHRPWLWRGRWVRLQVDVAGYAGSAGAEGAQPSTLLPAAPPNVARELLSKVLPGVDVDSVSLEPVPRIARWLDPLSWRNLAYGHDDRVFVTRTGVVTQVVAVVPHAKTQSVRMSQGPLDRALGLATVHVDSPPGPVNAVAYHRSALQARQIVDEQAERARAARAVDVRSRWMTTAAAEPPGTARSLEPAPSVEPEPSVETEGSDQPDLLHQPDEPAQRRSE